MLYRRLIEDHINVENGAENEKIVLSDGITNMTFRQIHEMSARYCALFQENGIRSGERILIIDYDLIHTVTAILACIAMGIIFVPLESGADEKIKGYILKDCRPSLILDENIQLGSAMLHMKNRPIQAENRLAYIMYTSGSEGVPKGVLAAQRQIIFCCEKINQRLEHSASDRILSCLPLTFDYGLYQVFLSFFSGAALFLDRGNVLQRVPYLIRRWKITGLPMISSIANIMTRAGLFQGLDGSSLRYITFTGEVLPVRLIQKLRALCPQTRIVPMYGLTECKRVSIMPAGREDKVEAGSCGLPLDGVKVWLEGPEETEKLGELVVDGPNVMEGYWGSEDQNGGTFFIDEKTGRRMLRTGDIFRMDDEGFLYFCERKGDIIKIRGHRVGVNWIEDQLKELNEVLEVKVFGIADQQEGERLAIGAYGESAKVREAIARKMKELPHYLWEYEIYIFAEPLPRNSNGKIDRKKLIRLVKEKDFEVLRK